MGRIGVVEFPNTNNRPRSGQKITRITADIRAMIRHITHLAGSSLLYPIFEPIEIGGGFGARDSG